MRTRAWIALFVACFAAVVVGSATAATSPSILATAAARVFAVASRGGGSPAPCAFSWSLGGSHLRMIARSAGVVGQLGLGGETVGSDGLDVGDTVGGRGVWCAFQTAGDDPRGFAIGVDAPPSAQPARAESYARWHGYELFAKGSDTGAFRFVRAGTLLGGTVYLFDLESNTNHVAGDGKEYSALWVTPALVIHVDTEGTSAIPALRTALLRADLLGMLASLHPARWRGAPAG
jgi:hypothetical protein